MNKIYVFILFISLFNACATKAPKFGNAEVLKKNEEFDQRVQIVLTEDPGAIQAETTAAGKATSSSSTDLKNEVKTVVPTTTLPKTSEASKTTTKIEKSKKSASEKKKVKTKKSTAKSEALTNKVDSPVAAVTTTTLSEGKVDGSVAASPSTASASTLVATSAPRREPDVESDKGFDGRRPLIDPFRVGEKIVHSVKYFKVQAGTLALEVRPYAFVNGKKSYNFTTSIKSSSFFSSFYAVDDYATTLMDFDTLVPSVYTMHVKESGQLREARALFDASTLKATFWDKKQTEKDGVQEKRIEWDMLPYSQNVYSAAYYMRMFQWDVGNENAFRIAHDGDNLIFKGKAIRREKITTKVGEFTALVIKPDIYLKGKFTPTGDIFIWLSDDDRKFILRIESEIKIGTLVSEIEELHKGY